MHISTTWQREETTALFKVPWITIQLREGSRGGPGGNVPPPISECPVQVENDPLLPCPGPQVLDYGPNSPENREFLSSHPWKSGPELVIKSPAPKKIFLALKILPTSLIKLILSLPEISLETSYIQGCVKELITIVLTIGTQQQSNHGSII